MAVIHGKMGRVRIGASVATTSTNVAATLSSDDDVTLTIANSSQRHWTQGSTMPRVYGATTDAELTDAYTVDCVRGRVVFSTAHSTAVAYKVDIAWVPMSCLGVTRSWTLDVSNDLKDVTVFPCSTSHGWRAFAPGLSEATISLGRLVATSESTAPPFIDRQALEAPLYVELHPDYSTGGHFAAYARIQARGNQVSVDDIAQETVTLKVDGPVYWTTST